MFEAESELTTYFSSKKDSAVKEVMDIKNPLTLPKDLLFFARKANQTLN